MRLSLALFLFAGLATGCATTLPPNLTHPMDAEEQRMLSLSEVADRIGWELKDGDLRREKFLVNGRGGKIEIWANRPDRYLYNTMPRAVEYPFVQYQGEELFIPLGMYNNICKDIGQLDAMETGGGVKIDRPFRDNVKLKAPSQAEIEAELERTRAAKSAAKPTETAAATGSLRGWTIVVDPGHGGKDPGGVGVSGVRESDVVLAASLRLKAQLEAQGAKVIMTRNSDVFIELDDRAAIANKANANLFISVHANIAPNSGSAAGIETWVHDEGERGNQSRKLAGAVNNGMVAKTGATNRGVKNESFRVLRTTKMPAVLVELGFLSNASEERKLAQGDYQAKLVSGILTGVLEYAKSSSPPTVKR